MQKIIPHLWYNDRAEEAVDYYLSIFNNAKIVRKSYYGEAGSKVAGRPQGSIMTITFEIEGQTFVALNGGPIFQFTPAISFLVGCKTQDEIDEIWTKLSAGGNIQPCGWVQDKFGVSWQVVPTILGEMIADADPVKAERVMKAMLSMQRIDLDAIKKAYEG